MATTRLWSPSLILVIFGTVLLGGALSYTPLQYERVRGFHHKQRYFEADQVDVGLEEANKKAIDEKEYLRVAASPRYRLNDSFIPSHYNLELLVLLDNDPAIGDQYTAPGKVSIDFQPTSDQFVLRLHANLIQVNGSSIKITNKNDPGQIFTISNVSNDTNSGKHFLEMNVSPSLRTNVMYEFYAEFVAPISRDRQNGLYLSLYTDPTTGEERRHTATQMESYHLRQVFPCFDEPHLKASFNVTIIRRDNYTTLGNEAITELGPDPTRPGYSIDRFSVPFKMTPYLFALVVSDFTYVEAPAEHYPGKKFRVYAPPYMISRGGGQYSANQSAIILKHLDDTFDFPYPLSKMDSVAIPIFAAGAMENYALNLYRPSLLIYYPGESLESERFLITNVLTHELAHQHFGNLVTCKWWSLLWLNEGFATWINYFGMDSVTPEFRATEDILNDAYQYSMPVDVSANTHPLQNDLVLSPEQIDDMFSTITYERGGSINRMVEGFLTKETFIKGLQFYLKDRQHNSAEQDDLWFSLQRAATLDNRLPSGLTVKQIMDTWTKQSGHPLVRVSAVTSNSIYISQERYGLSPDTGLWYVPITVVSQDNSTRENFIPDVWLEEFDLIKSYRVDTTKWVMINQDAYGYYRVLYDEPLRAKIQGQLERDASVISPLSRSQLLDDYLTLASHGLTSVESAMELTKYLAQENHFTVWDVVSRHMRKPYNLFGNNATVVEALKNYLLPRVEAALVRVGVEQDASHVGANAMYRAQLMDWACVFDHPACSNYSRELFQEWTVNTTVNPVPVDIQASMFCAIVKSNTNADEFMMERYREARFDATIKTRLRNSLACRNLASDLQSIINNIVFNSTSGLEASDRTPLLQRIAMNPEGRDVIMTLLERNLTDIISVIGGGGPAPVASIVSTLSGHLSTEAELARLEAFITSNAGQLVPINASLQNSLNTVRGNIEYVDEVGLPLFAWLKKATLGVFLSAFFNH